MLFRCPECRTRRHTWELFTRHLRESGHRLCTCGGYHYAHRPGSPFCERHPLVDLHRAMREHADPETLADIAQDLALDGHGLSRSAACPF